MTIDEYKQEYHKSDSMMSDVLRYYECEGLLENDIKELLEYAGEDDISLSDIVTKE